MKKPRAVPHGSGGVIVGHLENVFVPIQEVNEQTPEVQEQTEPKPLRLERRQGRHVGVNDVLNGRNARHSTLETDHELLQSPYKVAVSDYLPVAPIYQMLLCRSQPPVRE